MKKKLRCRSCVIFTTAPQPCIEQQKSWILLQRVAIRPEFPRHVQNFGVEIVSGNE